MRLLIIGKTGQVGSELLRCVVGEADVHAPGRAALDIEKPDQARAVLDDLQPDIVVNTAAFHDLVCCESEPERTFAINVTAAEDLATACRAIGARFVAFSTDYVFSGDKGTPYTEEDDTGPLQVYGKSRLAGERAVLAAHPGGAYVIRTCGLYGGSGSRSRGGNFVDKRIAEARAKQEIAIACEQVVSPTSAEDLAVALWSLLRRTEAQPGIYHLVNEGACSWYEFARTAIELAGLPVTVTPIDRQGRDGTGFRRPLVSALSNCKARTLGIVLPTWQDALQRYVQRRYGLTDARASTDGISADLRAAD
jgi:dTDP-4-dehydrorhamnose reductase